MLTVETVDTYPAFLRLKPCWDRLLHASGDMDIPFMTFDWFNLWWSFFGRGKRMMVLVCRQDGEPVGIIPLVRDMVWWRGLPVPAVTCMANHFSGRTGIVGTVERRNELMLAGLRCLLESRARFDLIMLDYLPADSTLVAHLDAALPECGLKFRKMNCWLSPYITIRESWEDYLKKRSHGLREKIKRTTNAFRRSARKLSIVTAPKEVEKTMDKIVAVSRRTWKYREGTAIANDPVRIDFYRRYAEYAAGLGMLKILVLEEGDAPVAFTFEIKYRQTDYFIKTGFDEKYSRFSPGIFILSESIREAFDTGYAEYDLMGTNEGYKMKFTDQIRTHCKYWVFNNSAYGRLLHTWEHTAVAGVKKLLEQHRQDSPAVDIPS